MGVGRPSTGVEQYVLEGSIYVREREPILFSGSVNCRSVYPGSVNCQPVYLEGSLNRGQGASDIQGLLYNEERLRTRSFTTGTPPRDVLRLLQFAPHSAMLEFTKPQSETFEGVYEGFVLDEKLGPLAKLDDFSLMQFIEVRLMDESWRNIQRANVTLRRV